jgi:hypothetical protein
MALSSIVSANSFFSLAFYSNGVGDLQPAMFS